MIKSFFRDKINKMLFILCIISIIIYFTYENSQSCEEWFEGAEEIFKFFSLLSLSYISSFIFYILQVFIPEYKNKLKVQFNIAYNLSFIRSNQEEFLIQLCVLYLNKNYSVKNLSLEQISLIGTNMDLNKVVDNDAIKENMTLGDKIEQIIIDTEKNIDKMYLYYGEYIDEEIKVILDEITNSVIHKNIKRINNSFKIMKRDYEQVIDNERYSDVDFTTYIKEYYTYYIKLDHLIEHYL